MKEGSRSCSRQVFGKYCDNVGDYDRGTFSIKKLLRDAVVSRKLNFERCFATDLNLIRTKIPGLGGALKGPCLHEISTLHTPLSPRQWRHVYARRNSRYLYTVERVYVCACI